MVALQIDRNLFFGLTIFVLKKRPRQDMKIKFQIIQIKITNYSDDDELGTQVK